MTSKYFTVAECLMAYTVTSGILAEMLTAKIDSDRIIGTPLEPFRVEIGEAIHAILCVKEGCRSLASQIMREELLQAGFQRTLAQAKKDLDATPKARS